MDQSKGIVANVSTRIDAPANKVWDALVTPETIKQYMFGASVESDWREGSPITWKGEWKGKPYQDKGKILKIDPGHRLDYSHFSPLSGQPEKDENYHTVSIELSEQGGRTLVQLSQDNNHNAEEREHSEQNWRTMLDGLKKVVEH